MRFVILLSLTSFLSGCATFPWPHRVQHVPRVSGVVLSNDTPVAGATIHIHDALTAGQCGPSSLSVTTDREGGFSFEGRRRLELLAVMGDRLNRWALCIELDGRFVAGWQANGVGYPPKQIVFTCDLQANARSAPGGSGLCRPAAEA
jgi:hypothetical protein